MVNIYFHCLDPNPLKIHFLSLSYTKDFEKINFHLVSITQLQRKNKAVKGEKKIGGKNSQGSA